jgi:hypothetical protein
MSGRGGQQESFYAIFQRIEEHFSNKMITFALQIKENRIYGRLSRGKLQLVG